MIQTLVVAIAVFFAACDSVAAQSLAWPRALEIAAQNNPELRAARENLKAAEFDTRGAGSGFLPQISGSARYTDSSVSGGSTLVSPTPTYSTSISATQNLFAGFRDQATVDQARGAQRGAAANLDLVKARVSFDLKSAFAQLRFAEDGLALSQDIIRRREDNLRLVELRYESGRENKGSLFLSKASLSQAKFERLQAEHAIMVAREQLAKVLGRGDGRDLAISGTVPIQSAPVDVDFLSLVRTTPDVRQATAQEQVAEAGVTLARSGFFPNLNLTGTLGRQGENWFPDDERNTVSLNLEIPLYTGGKDYFGVKSAVASRDEATATRENTEHDVLTRLQQAYTNYVQAVEKVGVDEDFVAAAAARAEIARTKYNNGLMSFEDWDNIENDLVNRQKTLLQSRRDRITAEANWEQVQGVSALP